MWQVIARVASAHRRALLVCTAVVVLLGVLSATLVTLEVGSGGPIQRSSALSPTAHQLTEDIAAASAASGVPAPLIAAVCFFEGGMSMHDAAPSEDNGYGCMHLAQNGGDDSLAQAATDLGSSPSSLKADMGKNIAGGADLLRDDGAALPEPRTLGDWYGAVAAYSGSVTRGAAQSYADAVYALLQAGFSTPLADGEVFTQAPIAVQPNTTTLDALHLTAKLPVGCVNDGKVDYPGAIDCILNPAVFDCSTTPPPAAGCSYENANRPTDLAINHIVIHDIEGTAQNALNWFQTPSSNASAHYIVDSDGTVYQVVPEQDISYQAGNWWYNQHSIGIEHAGVDAVGYAWYNAAEYLASAKLVAYLLKKYTIPLDHAHIVSHGTIPSPTLGTSPNHVDPGSWWLWDYYFGLIRAQGVSAPKPTLHLNVITVHPVSGKQPYGTGGRETRANATFYGVFRSATTKYYLVPYLGTALDPTNETFNVEPDMSYYYVAKKLDPGGSGFMLYEIWYGVNDQAHGFYWADGRLAWLAVPPSAAVQGSCSTTCSVVRLTGANGGTSANIYGRPTSDPGDIIGASPAGSVYVSEMNVTEDPAAPSPTPSPTASPFPTPTATPAPPVIWYEINFNHRQAWVPASEVVLM